MTTAIVFANKSPQPAAALEQVTAEDRTVSNVTEQEAPAEPDTLRISRHTLHGDVVERLRDMIIEGTLPPGSRINEGRLGGRLGVSRTPLREAIKSVAAEGLIELVPGRGALVKVLTPRDIQEMLQVLSALETTGARIACRTATDADIAALRRVHDEMMRCYENGNRLEYYKRNQAIHSGFARLSGNRFLAELHEAIQLRLKRIRYLGNAAPDNWRGAVLDHAAMIVALEARDEAALVSAVADHIDRSWLRIRDSI
jgi:DNA-binding GntR family transcriptional regulator